MIDTAFSSSERAAFALRALYERYGYTPYTMNKFEEYDLYVRNKDFLISDSVITFTDTNGRLLALKPDVTLSIVKNTRDTVGVQKVYYNENVYRVSESTHAFREIMQAGLECIGEVDDYCLYEVLLLAAQSLAAVSDNWVLDISHIGVLSSLLAPLGDEASARLLACIGEKNRHELAAACERYGVDAATAEALSALVSTYGAPSTVLPALRERLGDNEALCQLETLVAAFDEQTASHLRIDFSVIENTTYYNGLVFKGFIDGVPDSVLSGGRYDNLMKKLGRRSGAVGFAVYLDLLERLGADENPYDADAVLVYDTASVTAVKAAMEMLTADGKRVLATTAVPEKRRYRQLWRLDENGVTKLEDHA